MSASETPVTDEELDSLMAELEASTGVAAAAPSPPPVVKVVAAEPEGEPVEVEGLNEVDLEVPSDPAEPVVLEDGDNATVLPSSATSSAELSVEDELAALEAEIGSAPLPEEPEPVATAGNPDQPKAVIEVVPAKPTIGLNVAVRSSGSTVTPAAAEPVDEEEAKAAARKAAVAKLDYWIDVDAFKGEMQVTETNLDNCMMSQASLRAHYGARAARAEAQASALKARFEVREAKLYDTYRKAAIAAGEKATEKSIENSVKLDPMWIAGKTLLIEAESIAAVAKACVASLSDRRDMIIQLGADRRDESKGQVRIMAAAADRDALRDRALNARQANG